MRYLSRRCLGGIGALIRNACFGTEIVSELQRQVEVTSLINAALFCFRIAVHEIACRQYNALPCMRLPAPDLETHEWTGEVRGC